MPFRNSFVAAVIATASAGKRIVIDGSGALSNTIQFFSGWVTEVGPATITGTANSPAGGSRLTMSGPTQEPDPTPRAFLTLGSGPLGTEATLTAETVRIGSVPDGLPANIVGPWNTFAPELRGSVTDPTGYTSSGAWTAVGRTLFYRFRFDIGPGFTNGAGIYGVELPRQPADDAAQAGAGWWVDAGTAWRSGVWATGGDPAELALFYGAADRLQAGDLADGDVIGGSITFEADGNH